MQQSPILASGSVAYSVFAATSRLKRNGSQLEACFCFVSISGLKCEADFVFNGFGLRDVAQRWGISGFTATAARPYIESKGTRAIRAKSHFASKASCLAAAESQFAKICLQTRVPWTYSMQNIFLKNLNMGENEHIVWET